MESEIPKTKEYKMAGEYRRCVIYVLVGFCVAVPIPLSVNQAPSRSLEVLIPISLFCIPFIVLLISPFSWKIRVDETGLSRRRFWNWDFWSWDDFASGEVHKLGSFRFHHSTRRWVSRSLELRYLENDVRTELLQTINGYYQPVAVDVPDELHLKIGYIISRRIVLDSTGITWKRRDDEKQFCWDQVSRVEIVRYDVVRYDFRILTLYLPDMELQLNNSDDDIASADFRFRGAPSEQVNSMVLSHVDSSRFDVVVISGRIKAAKMRKLFQDLEKLDTRSKSQ